MKMKTGLSILILSLLLIQMLAQRVSTTQRTPPINTRVGSYGGIQTKLGGTTSISSRPTSTRTTSTTGTSSTSRTSATSRIIGASGAVSGAQKPTQRGSIVSTEPIRVGESIITSAQERVEPGRLMTSTNGDRFSSTSSLLESDPHRRHVNSTNERFGNIIEEFKVIERKESTPVIGDYKKINLPKKTTMNSKYTDNSDNVFGEIDYDVLAAELYPDNEDFNPSIKERISYSSSTNSTSQKGTEESQETSEYSKPKEDVSPPKPSPEQIKKAREKAIAEYKQELEKAKLEAVREYQTELARKQAIEEFEKQLAQQEIKKGKQELVEIFEETFDPTSYQQYESQSPQRNRVETNRQNSEIQAAIEEAVKAHEFEKYKNPHEGVISEKCAFTVKEQPDTFYPITPNHRGYYSQRNEMNPNTSGYYADTNYYSDTNVTKSVPKISSTPSNTTEMPNDIIPELVYEEAPKTVKPKRFASYTPTVTNKTQTYEPSTVVAEREAHIAPSIEYYGNGPAKEPSSTPEPSKIVTDYGYYQEPSEQTLSYFGNSPSDNIYGGRIEPVIYKEDKRYTPVNEDYGTISYPSNTYGERIEPAYYESSTNPKIYEDYGTHQYQSTSYENDYPIIDSYNPNQNSYSYQESSYSYEPNTGSSYQSLKPYGETTGNDPSYDSSSNNYSSYNQPENNSYSSSYSSSGTSYSGSSNNDETYGYSRPVSTTNTNGSSGGSSGSDYNSHTSNQNNYSSSESSYSSSDQDLSFSDGY